MFENWSKDFVTDFTDNGFDVDVNEYTPTLTVKFKSFDKPYKWVYWPVDGDGQWKTRMDILL